MKYCQKCGTGLPDESNFCANCGTTFSLPKKQKSVWVKILFAFLFIILGFILGFATYLLGGLWLMKTEDKVLSDSTEQLTTEKVSTNEKEVKKEEVKKQEKKQEKKPKAISIYTEYKDRATLESYISDDDFVCDYKYDDKDNLIEEKMYIPHSGCGSSVTYKYDNLGRCTEKTTDNSNEEEIIIEKVVYEYKGNSMEAATSKTYINDELSGTTEYTYENKKLISEDFTSAGPDASYYIHYTYDSGNGLLMYTEYSDSCLVTTHSIYKYDDNNLLTYIEEFSTYHSKFDYQSTSYYKY